MLSVFIVVLFCFLCSSASARFTDSEIMVKLHEKNVDEQNWEYSYILKDKQSMGENNNQEESTHSYWFQNAQNVLRKHKRRELNKNVAKNVILFMGDGMSLPTTTTARIQAGGLKHHLSFEHFPHTGLSKTYCLNLEVSESTCTSTAYLTGVKANAFTSGVTGAVKYANCTAMNIPENHASSIADWSQRMGKRTGFVTNARVTHASPAALYSHVASRAWESDKEVISYDKLDPRICHDIAYQLINNPVGKKLNVVFGGGRAKFTPQEERDEEGKLGDRMDKQNLIWQWMKERTLENESNVYIWNKDQMMNLDDKVDNVLGLFASQHMDYHHEADRKVQPSLADMTEAAINVLDKGDEGFFLFVEGALIDTAHHENWARTAIEETIEFDKAVKKAIKMTNVEDTLIVVIADHSHTMSFGGDTWRGVDIFGVSENFQRTKDNLPILSISYANGPGYRKRENDEERHDFSKDRFGHKFRYPTTFPNYKESHGGEDTITYARGPWSHLFEGVIEQNVIPHIMAYASCVGHGQTACQDHKSSSNLIHSFHILVFILLFIFVRLLSNIYR